MGFRILRLVRAVGQSPVEGRDYGDVIVGTRLWGYE